MGKVDDRIPILQLAKSRNNKSKETEIWVKKDGFKLDSRLGWKIETFWDSYYKLTCDQLYASHSEFARQKPKKEFEN